MIGVSGPATTPTASGRGQGWGCTTWERCR
jgi:hypothetical protein